MRLMDGWHSAFYPDGGETGLREADVRNLPAEIDEIQGGREFMREMLSYLQINRRAWDGIDFNQMEEGFSSGRVRAALRKSDWLHFHKIGGQYFWCFTRKARDAMAPRPAATPEVPATTT